MPSFAILWEEEDDRIEQLQTRVNAYTLKDKEYKKPSKDDLIFSYYNLLPTANNGLTEEEVGFYQIEGKVWLASNSNAIIFDHLLTKDLFHIERLIMYNKALNRAKC